VIQNPQVIRGATLTHHSIISIKVVEIGKVKDLTAPLCRKSIARSVFYVVHAMPIARQQVAKHIPAEQ
jgi:hypothetical protein